MALDVPLLLPKTKPAGSEVADEAAQKLYESAAPAVVLLEGVSARGRSRGSGFFIDNEHIVTNHHVVASNEVMSVICNGKSYPARIERLDDINDLAILRVKDIPPDVHGVLQIGSTAGLSAKDRLYVLGHPEGSKETYLSVGNFASKGTMESYVIYPKMGFWPRLMDERQSSNPAIKADAEAMAQSTRILSMTPIRHGNSGGPLIGADGRLVGVVSNGNEHEGKQSLSVPVDNLNKLLMEPSKFSFDYETKSKIGLSPSLLVCYGLAGALSLKAPRVGVPLVGAMSALGSISHTNELMRAHDNFQFGCSALDLTSDALMAGGAIASFFPKARPFGYAAFAVGFAGELIGLLFQDMTPWLKCSERTASCAHRFTGQRLTSFSLKEIAEHMH